MEVDPTTGIIISILLMALIILIGNVTILKTKPLPITQSLVIAAVSNLLGKLFVSVLHLPGIVSYSVPTIAFFILSYYFFKPTIIRLLVYWVVGFAAYLIIHILISALLDWTFMFPFWKVTL